MENKLKEFKTEPQQIETSKALGGRIKDVPVEAWNDNNHWIAEKKLDGTRLKMEINHEGNRFTTRRISEKTGKYMDRTNNFPHLRDLELPELEGTIIDGEGFAPSHSFNDTASIIGSGPEKSWERQKEKGKLEYWVFDIIKLKGKDLTKIPYRDRHIVLVNVVKEIRKKYPDVPIFISGWTTINKVKYYHDIVAEDGEGIMLKNLNSTYYDRHGMYKVKRFERFTMIITGFKDGDGKYKGAVGSIGVGFYGEEQLTYASGLSDEQRWGIAKNKEKYLGRVVEIECERLTITGSLRHPRFVGFRVDKSKEDCTRNQNEVK